MTIQTSAQQPAIAEKYERLLDVREVARRRGVSTRTIWREVKAGRFPKPVYPGAGHLARWKESVVEGFLAQL